MIHVGSSQRKLADDSFRLDDRNNERVSASLRMTPPEIFLRNLQRKIRVDVSELQTFATRAVRYCLQLHKQQDTDLKKLNEIFVCLISDRRMAFLHGKFLHQSGPTDVLTFQHGEIFISVETAKRHARTFRNSLTGELCLYIAHGLLHLHGFDDRTQTAARKMKATQKKVIRNWDRHRKSRQKK